MTRALLFTLLTIPCSAQVVDWPLPTVVAGGCSDFPGTIEGPCDSLGLALCLYPENPGFGMAGTTLIVDGAAVCSDNGLRVDWSLTDAVVALVIPFGSQDIEYILVDGEGDYTWSSNYGTPPFTITGQLIVTITGTGVSTLHRIRVMGPVHTGVYTSDPVTKPNPRPQIYYWLNGQIYANRLKRRP